MRRFRIGPRLTVSFLIIVLLMFLGGVVALWQFGSMGLYIRRLHQIDREAIAISRMHNSVLTLKDELQQLAEIQDVARFTEEAVELREEFIGYVDEAVATISQSHDLNEDRARLLSKLGAIRASLPAQVDSMIELAQADDWLAVELRLNDQVLKTSQIIQNEVDQINNRVEEEQVLAREKMEQVGVRASSIILATGLVTLLAAGGLGLAVTHSIDRPLSRLSVGAQALARGDFDHQIVVTGGDELTHLARVFNDAASQLAELYARLEQKVRERTAQLRQRALQLETSMAVGHRITSILDLDELLLQVAELIKERYDTYYVGIFLLDEGGTRLHTRAGTGRAGQILSEQGFGIGIESESIIGWVGRSGRPLRVDDVSQDDRYLELEALPLTRSELALPLEMGGKLLGVLDIQSDRVGAFEEDEVPVFELLADQVAVAIQNAELYQGERSRRWLAETLHRAARALTSTLDPAEVLDLSLEHLTGIVPYDRASVVLGGGDGEMEILAARGFPEGSNLMGLRVSPAEGQRDTLRQIYAAQRPVVVADASEGIDWEQVEGVAPARAWLGVPLIRSDEVVGMFSISREAPGVYDEEDATLVATFAGQAAIALENARLYQRITRFNQELEEIVRERTEALQIAYERLEQLDRTKSDFISIASHELRTPLTVLRGYSKMLLTDPLIEGSEYHRDLVSGIHSGAIRLHEIVNSMLDMAKIDSRALQLYPEPLVIPFLMESLCEDFEEALAERDLSLVVEDVRGLPAIEADLDALHKTFYHLISNAIKYTPDGGRITISGRPVEDMEGYPEGGVEIVVSDTGIGIDPQYHELIFAKFYQTGQVALHSTGKTKFKGGGPGLGLAIARGIVRAHGGKIWVESPGCDDETCPGSEFHVVLPVHQAAG